MFINNRKACPFCRLLYQVQQAFQKTNHVAPKSEHFLLWTRTVKTSTAIALSVEEVASLSCVELICSPWPPLITNLHQTSKCSIKMSKKVRPLLQGIYLLHCCENFQLHLMGILETCRGTRLVHFVLAGTARVPSILAGSANAPSIWPLCGWWGMGIVFSYPAGSWYK